MSHGLNAQINIARPARIFPREPSSGARDTCLANFTPT